MKTKKVICYVFYVLSALLCGCVPIMSLHPLYTDEDLIFEENLLGTWVDDSNNPETVWEFKRLDKLDKKYEKAYTLIFSDKDGKKGSFVVHLAKLNNRIFLDGYPSERPWELKDPNKIEWPYNYLFFIPAHSFMAIDSIEPQLKMRWATDETIKKLLTKNPDAIQHQFIEDRVVLTAPTKQLQSFILKYMDDNKIFPAQVLLTRTKTECSPRPGR